MSLDGGDSGGDASLMDVVLASKLLTTDAEKQLSQSPPNALLSKFGVNEESWPEFAEPFEMYVQSMRQSLSS